MLLHMHHSLETILIKKKHHDVVAHVPITHHPRSLIFFCSLFSYKEFLALLQHLNGIKSLAKKMFDHVRHNSPSGVKDELMMLNQSDFGEYSVSRSLFYVRNNIFS